MINAREIFGSCPGKNEWLVSNVPAHQPQTKMSSAVNHLHVSNTERKASGKKRGGKQKAPVVIGHTWKTMRISDLPLCIQSLVQNIKSPTIADALSLSSSGSPVDRRRQPQCPRLCHRLMYDFHHISPLG